MWEQGFFGGHDCDGFMMAFWRVDGISTGKNNKTAYLSINLESFYDLIIFYILRKGTEMSIHTTL